MEKSVVEESGTSTRTAAIKSVYQNTTELMLYEQLLYCYHPKQLQGLTPTDYPGELHSANGFYENVQPHFLSGILFTKEAGFIYNCITNFHNTHVDRRKPQTTLQLKHEHDLSMCRQVLLGAG
jgi:hypothetical protein